MKAPNHFQAVNLLTQQPNVPPPARSRYRKFDIYRDVGQFRFIDEHAISVSIAHIDCKSVVGRYLPAIFLDA